MIRSLAPLLLVASLSCGTQPKVKVVEFSIYRGVEQDEKYDKHYANVDDLSQLEETVTRFSSIYEIGVKGAPFSISRRDNGSSTIIGKEKGLPYILTNYHLIVSDPLYEIKEEQYFNIAGRMAGKGLKVPSIDKMELELQESSYKIFHKGMAYSAELVASDKYNDLALLKVLDVSEEGTFNPVLRVGNSDELELGHVLYLSGFGKNRFRPKTGMWSRKTEPNQLRGEMHEWDGESIGGHSAGGTFALRDGKLEFIGLHSGSIYDFPVFIPISIIKEFLEKEGYKHLLNRDMIK
jgi:hypothetical protein